MNIESPHLLPADRRRTNAFISWPLLIGLMLILLALRIAYAKTMRFDSDEPQHLHVVWAWTQGMLPYKDVFDNHSPLFQWLSAPLLRLLGERPDIVVPMRWAMIPLFFLSVYLVYRAGRAVLSPALAFWAAIGGCLLPRGFLKSIEYRPDDLWAALWFAFLAVLVTGRSHSRRALAAGVIMGISFAVSMKTTLMLLATVVSFAVLLLLQRFQGKESIGIVRWLKMSGAALVGMSLAPALVAGYFYAQGALLSSQSGLHSLWYCVIEHNIVPGMKRWTQPHYLDPWIVVLFCFLIAGAIFLYRQEESAAVRHRKVVLFLAPGCYLLLLYGFWPDITREDDPPLYPLIPLALAILGASWVQRHAETIPARLRAVVPWLAFAGLLGWLVATLRPWDKENRRQVSTMATILKLTEPNEYVMDAKSGSVFRQRPFFFVVETVTRARMRRGLIRDEIPQRLIETKTTIADNRGYIHQSKGEAFIFANYLPLASNDAVGVAGKSLTQKPSAKGDVIRFQVAIAARYAVIDEQGRVPGLLDGIVLDAARDLAPGEHTFSPSAPCSRLMLVLAKAVDLGYQPQLPKPGT